MSDTNHLHELTTCGHPLVEQQAKAGVALVDRKKAGTLDAVAFKTQMEALITETALKGIDQPQHLGWIKGAIGLNILLNT
jgi:hypothetical protein